VNVAVPVAVESLRGSMVALARGPSAAAGADEAQPDRTRAAAAENVNAERVLIFIRLPPSIPG
jgi:hypothetical protein